MLDPATDAQQHQFNAADKARVARDDAMLIKYMPKTMVADYQFLLEQLNAAPKQVTPLPSTVPTTIITASKPSEQAFVFSETVEGRKIWVSLHQQLISNHNIQNQTLLNSVGHNIHKEHPELVINSINALINQTKS